MDLQSQLMFSICQLVQLSQDNYLALIIQFKSHITNVEPNLKRKKEKNPTKQTQLQREKKNPTTNKQTKRKMKKNKREQLKKKTTKQHTHIYVHNIIICSISASSQTHNSMFHHRTCPAIQSTYLSIKSSCRQVLISCATRGQLSRLTVSIPLQSILSCLTGFVQKRPA